MAVPKKAPVMRLPAEQQALLTTLLPKLQRMANTIHYRHLCGQDLCTPRDLLQDSMFSMLCASVYPPVDVLQLKRWAYTVIKSKALNFVGKNQRDREGSYVYLREQEYHAIVPHSNEDKVAYLLRMSQKHLRPIVHQVVVGYGLGRTGKQLSAELGIPHSTVKTHFHGARKRLQELCLTYE